MLHRCEQGCHHPARVYDHDALKAYVTAHVDLPLRQLEVYQLHVIKRLSVTETAHELGVAHETVRAHLRALRIAARKHGEAHPKAA